MDTSELIVLLQAFQAAHGDVAVLIDDGAAHPAVIENVRLGVCDGQTVVLLDLM